MAGNVYNRLISTQTRTGNIQSLTSPPVTMSNPSRPALSDKPLGNIPHIKMASGVLFGQYSALKMITSLISGGQSRL